ncbi:MAG TPA: phosphocholine cytidylyltransferase family protein [Archaeoglobaceae archaeon]|nr:phosphocholine cytidylyltransferase family protein [Archaeoglobaceae archaeon]
MIAIILAAGVGRRLRPLTNIIPKSLIKIGKKEILAYQIDYLKEYNVDNFVIATGLFHQKVEQFIRNNYPDINVLFVYNPIYKKTNYIYTLWLTKDYVNDDIVLLHGDLIFDKKIVKKLVDAKRSVVVVSKESETNEKDFKALVVNNRVIKIDVNIYGKNVFSCMPMYKLKKDDIKLWFMEIKKFIKREKVNCYAEEALNNITSKIRLYPLYFKNELCMEIDTMEDIKIAKNYLCKNE